MTNSFYANFLKRYKYTGRILTGPYGDRVQKSLMKAIVHLDALEKVGTPTIPYIAAWVPGDGDIWYEYAGKRLHEILGAKDAELATTLRRNLIARCLYRNQLTPPGIVKIIRDKVQINQMRKHLRRMAERGGTSEVVYKLDVPGGAVWFKDLARIEVHENEKLVISYGSLIEVTKEMQLEEELSAAKEALQYHRKNLEWLVEERTRELRKTQLEVVSRLTQAAGCRDDKTGAHGRRLSQYCSIIGKSYGLSKGANWLLYHAVPMHDVGKLGIADSILLKEGPLSEHEFDVIKGHCRLGADLLGNADSNLLKVARVVALTHHERWDGSGYPSGISGRDIPLVGRITSICDVFDALTTARPYKKAWGFAEAVEEIENMRDIHFDPTLVDHFLRNMNSIQQVYDLHRRGLFRSRLMEDVRICA